MRRAGRSRDRAPAGRRRARRRARRAARRRRAARPPASRSGSASRAAVLVFDARRPAGATRGRSATALADAGVPALVATSAAAGRALLCAVVDADSSRSGRGPRGAPARRSPQGAGATACGPPPAGRAAVEALRRGLPRGPLRARGDLARQRATPPTVASLPRPRRLHAAALRSRTTRRCACTATALLGPIESGEGEYGGELLRSLEAFIEHNGQLGAGRARQLYCHRHTLRYRIRKIEELTGRDLGARATGSSSGSRCGRGSW